MAMTDMRSIVLALALSLAVVLPPPASAAPSLFDEFVVTSWTEENGLFGGWIVGLAQDAKGYLWIGTVSGLIRFDGLNFERFEGTATTRLPRRSVSAVYGASDGSIWVGFSGGGGIYQIRDTQIREFGVGEGLGEARTAEFVEDRDGAMLAATPNGLYRLQDHRWQLVTIDAGQPRGAVTSLYRDRGGRVWAAGATGLFRRDAIGSAFGLVEPLTYSAQSLGESSAGEMWTVHPQRGFAPVGSAERLPALDTTKTGSGYRLLHDRSGNRWVATIGQGLWFQRGARGPLEIIDSRNGLSSDSVRTLFEDRHGDLWVGTTAGLHRLSRRRVQMMSDLGVVWALATGRDGDVWVGTTSGLMHFTASGRQRYTERDGLPDRAIRGLHMDARGRLWISTAGGIATWEHGRFERVWIADGKPLPGGPTTMAVDRAGQLWVCTEDHGLFRLSHGKLEAMPIRTDGVTHAIHTVVADRAGDIWLMLGGGGLARIEPGGAVSLLRLSDKFHRSDLAMNQDDTDTLWFGAGDRLSRYHAGELSAVTADQGLPADAIRALVSDRDGSLWIGTSAGIIRITAPELSRIFDHDHESPLDYRSYSSADGLQGVPVRVGLPNAVRAGDGRLWFVTGSGIAIIDPRQLSTPRPEPPVQIERLTANGRVFDPQVMATLPPRTTSLQVDYTALEFASPRQVQFRYRLVGLSDEWIDAGTRRQALFTNLPPRDYRFEVVARSSDGIWSSGAAHMNFGIAPTFYQTRWFMALSVALLAAAVWGFYSSRRQQLRRQFEVVLDERARMAREIHDTLLQSLAGLELQVDAMSAQIDGDSSGVKHQLERVRRQIQSDVSEARQSIFGLRSPTLETRDLAGALRDVGVTLAEVSGVRFEATVSGTRSVNHRVEEHLLRVGREAISNAMRHAKARTVRLELRYSDDAIVMRVTDDGCGFDVEATATADSRHWGLASMRERATAIGGRLQLVSQPGVGTNLEIVAPLS